MGAVMTTDFAGQPIIAPLQAPVEYVTTLPTVQPPTAAALPAIEAPPPVAENPPANPLPALGGGDDALECHPTPLQSLMT